MYNKAQKREMAHEIARAGGILSQAVDALRLNYETFDKVGLTTLRRCMSDAGFCKMVREEEQLLSRVRRKTRTKTEESRVELESLGTMDLQRVARDALRRLQEVVRKTPQPEYFEIILRYMEFLEGVRKERKGSKFHPEDMD